MDAILNPKNASDNAGDFANIAKTVVVSKYVVQFDLKTPDNGLPGLMTDNFFIGDMTLRAKEGAKAFAEHPVGTGPYEWSSRTVGVRRRSHASTATGAAARRWRRSSCRSSPTRRSPLSIWNTATST